MHATVENIEKKNPKVRIITIQSGLTLAKTEIIYPKNVGVQVAIDFT